MSAAGGFNRSLIPVCEAVTFTFGWSISVVYLTTVGKMIGVAWSHLGPGRMTQPFSTIFHAVGTLAMVAAFPLAHAGRKAHLVWGLEIRETAEALNTLT